MPVPQRRGQPFPITKEMRRKLRSDNKRRPATLTPIPKERWPEGPSSVPRLEIWESKSFIVQLFFECGVERMSVNRTMVKMNGDWEDGITWDELMECKRQIGRGDTYAIEVYPRDKEIVDVANLRHLWLMPEPLPYGWR